eukprot:TRINITY_DN39438_c0_g1_i2.p1 TRINITY_DN39438_c0_g1~~TRINITY_DN39438_c0_g1_i2.p1  ORF type:complete len:325 (+),score=68.13 TRINITY_DN39438_c0_g1_i2:262-1236(+)
MTRPRLSQLLRSSFAAAGDTATATSEGQQTAPAAAAHGSAAPGGVPAASSLGQETPPGASGMAKTGVMRKVPANLKKDFLKAAGEYALRDDWSCAVSPPRLNDSLPGFRYGASMPTRPELLMLPCPCAGGSWAAPKDYVDSSLSAAGGWKPRRAEPPTERSSEEASFSYMPPEQREDQSRGFLSMLTKHFSKKPEVGTEPYAADYRCARGFKKDPFLSAGKRWWYQPDYAVVPVATPCPCALGVFTGLQGAPGAARMMPTPAKSADAFGLHGDWSIPDWQNGRSTMLSGFPQLPAVYVAPAMALRQRALHEELDVGTCPGAAFL